MELMMVIMLIALVGSMAVPSFRSYTRNSRVTATQNDLVTALSVARSEALKRSLPVTVCASTNGTSCAGNAAKWVGGWIAFTDNTGALGVVNSGTNGDEILQVWGAPGGETTIAASSHYVQYQPVGTAGFDGATPATFDLAWPHCTGKSTRHVSVSLVGSPRAEIKSCS
jgi:type IV fimbrial biogenesis protein FimT